MAAVCAAASKFCLPELFIVLRFICLCQPSAHTSRALEPPLRSAALRSRQAQAHHTRRRRRPTQLHSLHRAPAVAANIFAYSKEKLRHDYEQ